MTTQVTIKNHGPHKVKVKSFQWDGDDDTPFITGQHTLSADEGLTLHVWKDVSYSIEEVKDDEKL